MLEDMMTNSLSNVAKISELGAATQCGSHSACRISLNIERLAMFAGMFWRANARVFFEQFIRITPDLSHPN
jgi:hypothetical protein